MPELPHKVAGVVSSHPNPLKDALVQTMASIYILIDPVTEEIRYVGWTSKPLRARWQSHLRERHRCHRMYWIQSLRQNSLVPRIMLLSVPRLPPHEWDRRGRGEVGSPHFGRDEGQAECSYETSVQRTRSARRSGFTLVNPTRLRTNLRRYQQGERQAVCRPDDCVSEETMGYPFVLGSESSQSLSCSR